MRFKNQKFAKPPEIELTPMLNVMMGILAFFVMITMTLASEQGVGIDLPAPARPGEASEQSIDDILVVQLQPTGEISLNDQPLTDAELQAQASAHLANRPEGFVVLQADPDAPYEQVVQRLQQMKKIGGDRVSLAIE